MRSNWTNKWKIHRHSTQSTIWTIKKTSKYFLVQLRKVMLVSMQQSFSFSSPKGWIFAEEEKKLFDYIIFYNENRIFHYSVSHFLIVSLSWLINVSKSDLKIFWIWIFVSASIKKNIQTTWSHKTVKSFRILDWMLLFFTLINTKRPSFCEAYIIFFIFRASLFLVSFFSNVFPTR